MISNYLSNGHDHFGFGAGITYNFPIQSRLTAGIDFRGSISPGATGGGFGAASLRFGFVPHHNPLRPYLQLGGGFVTSKVAASYSTTGNQSVTNDSIDLAFGLDVRITPSFDWRAVEIASAAGNSGSTTVAVASIGTGIVYHFPKDPSRL